MVRDRVAQVRKGAQEVLIAVFCHIDGQLLQRVCIRGGVQVRGLGRQVDGTLKARSGLFLDRICDHVIILVIMQLLGRLKVRAARRSKVREQWSHALLLKALFAECVAVESPNDCIRFESGPSTYVVLSLQTLLQLCF